VAQGGRERYKLGIWQYVCVNRDSNHPPSPSSGRLPSHQPLRSQQDSVDTLAPWFVGRFRLLGTDASEMTMTA